MAQIGCGYGSEWQLLRMLGHHRDMFYSELKKQMDIPKEAQIQWLDYDFDGSNISGDKEYKQRGFFRKIPNIFTPEIIENIKKDAFGSKLKQNWDGIFWVNKTVYLVEAKAHLGEIRSDCHAKSKKSILLIDKYFQETKRWFKISSNNDWKKTYYQMANRVAFLKLLLSHNVEARLVNIYFVDGYERRARHTDSKKYYTVQNKNVSIQNWKEVIFEEERYLGVTDLTGRYIYTVFINCKEHK